jgi:nitric oxide synthase oxygenase domain/subunit
MVLCDDMGWKGGSDKLSVQPLEIEHSHYENSHIYDVHASLLYCVVLLVHVYVWFVLFVEGWAKSKSVPKQWPVTENVSMMRSGYSSRTFEQRA